MPRITVVTDAGELVENILVSEYSLDNPAAKACLVDDIFEAIGRTLRIEAQQVED